MSKRKARRAAALSIGRALAREAQMPPGFRDLPLEPAQRALRRYRRLLLRRGQAPALPPLPSMGAHTGRLHAYRSS